MANIKLTELQHIPDLDPFDVLVIDDVSALVTHKLSLANLIQFTGNAHAVSAELDAYAANTNAALANISTDFSISADNSSSSVLVGEELLSLLGDGAILTEIASNVVTISLSETGVGANNYGSVDGEILQLPSITVDAQGRITAVELLNYTSGAADVEARRAANTFYSYSANTVTSNASIVPEDTQTLGSETNRWDYLYAGTLDIGLTRIREYITYGVSSVGSVVFSEAIENFKFAKLIINNEDITYGQTQCSELLLVHDGSVVNITEYAIVHTSTQPIVQYSADIVEGQVELTARTSSANNTIKVLAFKN